MLIEFFLILRKYKLKTSIRELLDLINALKKQVIFADIDAFYLLARTILVKDETQYDRFDKAFADYFSGIQDLDILSALQQTYQVPEDWLRKDVEKNLSPEEKAQIEAMGGLEKLMDTLKKRFEEQKERHAGGNKWIGTGGTSAFGSGVIIQKGFALEKITQDKEKPSKFGSKGNTVIWMLMPKLVAVR